MNDDPILKPGEPAPGGWEPDPENPKLRRWQGLPSWRTVHGEAVVLWSLGSPLRTEDALLPGGNRGMAECLGKLTDRPDNNWRRQDGRGGWIWGEVTLDADAVFKDADPQPRPDPPRRSDDGKPNMEVDLWEDAAVLAAVQDDNFAQALYAAMCNQDWRKGDEDRWNCSWRRSGRIVANLRGKGEIYNDWYCSGISDEDAAPRAVVPEGVIREDVRHLLGRLGWHPMSDMEIEADLSVLTARIEELERLPERGMPEWYRSWRLNPDVPFEPDLETWSGRLHNLAATGRIDQANWRGMWELLDHEVDRPVHDARAIALLTEAYQSNAQREEKAPAPPPGATLH